METTYKPSDFNNPILKALGQLSGFEPGITVHLDAIQDHVLNTMGITGGMEAFGFTKNGRVTQLSTWISRAFDNLKRWGDVEIVRKKQWSLTPQGVQKAKKLCGIIDTLTTISQEVQETPVVDVAMFDNPVQDEPEIDGTIHDDFIVPIPAPPADVVPRNVPPQQAQLPLVDPSVGTQLVEAKPESIPVLPKTNPAPIPDYMNDPVIKQSVIKSTKCFGYEVEGHDLCLGCYIRPECVQAKYKLLVEVAREVTKQEREEEARRQREEEEAERKRQQEAASSFLEDLPDDEVASDSSDTSNKASLQAGATYQRITASVEGICAHCGQNLPKDSEVIWVVGFGLYHVDCFKEPK